MKMKHRTLITACSLCLALSACTPGPRAQDASTRTEATIPASTKTTVGTTVDIDGKRWTCQTITASGNDECGALTQQAFDTYKENLDSYVRSGELGVFSGEKLFTYYDAAFAGLVACAIMIDKRDSNAYIDAMLVEEPFKTKLTERSSYIPAWLAAKKHLCADLEQTTVNTGDQSTGDVRVE
ncbi:hypothetical protein [Arthrobacter sp. C9C5]|uniref:hypothetical protein n=1 Tax=Arthrobacter sp. C9C5 TaxID=2735267 RepID=UPI0015858499|nr:hypothetical protein [Arthrobacter sp. C9C5]NUU30125.1 hypothetical protein [Arthrobacter sp. C9C5]